jgi:hypothetical protein
MLETRLAFHVTAKVDARLTGQKNVGENDVGIHIGQPRQGGVAVGQADHFKTFVPQNPLAHSLRVGAIVSQKDAAHRTLKWSTQFEGGLDVPAAPAAEGWAAAAGVPAACGAPPGWAALDCAAG